MSETTFTLPAELEFDPDNYGSCRLAFGLLDDHGRSSDISIEGSDDRAIALANEVVRRWNAHDDLVAALKAWDVYDRESRSAKATGESAYSFTDFQRMRDNAALLTDAALAKVRGEA